MTTYRVTTPEGTQVIEGAHYCADPITGLEVLDALGQPVAEFAPGTWTSIHATIAETITETNGETP